MFLFPADETIYLDLDDQYPNGDRFFVHSVRDVVTRSSAKQTDLLVDHVKVCLQCVDDLRDFQYYSAKLVLEGQALLVLKPFVPHYLLHDFEDFYNIEKNACERAKLAHALIADRIIEEESPRLKSYLLVFPNGITCSADFTSCGATTHDEKVELQLRNKTHASELGKGKYKKKVTQHFSIMYWLVRIVGSERRVFKKALGDDDDDDYNRSMKGMKL